MAASPFKQLLVALVTLSIAACSATHGHIRQNKPIAAINSERGVALQGYDTVAYFTDGQSALGSDEFQTRWRDVVWKFASANHHDLFIANPEQYAPQFGGYCAYAVSRGLTADIDVDRWAIVDKKLYLNNNAFAHQLWQGDRDHNIDAGHSNWPLIPKIQSR